MNWFTDGVSWAKDKVSGVADSAAKTVTDPFSTSVSDDTLSQSQYDFSYLAFPNDLTSDARGHYMVININVPVYKDGTQRSSYSGAATLLPNEYSKVDVLRFGSGAGATASGGAQREAFSLPRYTRRIAQSVALYMPGSIVYSSQPRYEEISLTAMSGQLLAGAVQGAGSVLGGAVGTMLGGAVGSLVGSQIGSAGAGLVTGAGQAVGQLAQIAGYPINPRVEVLFSTTPQRQFVFDILMAPRNEKESETIQSIIQTLRYHAAPEIDSKTYGLTFIPPAEFDITFYNKGQENTSIPRINTCVMDRIEVDVAPQGVYSTFSNGHPVAVRLLLGFREIEIGHKRRILQGF